MKARLYFFRILGLPLFALAVSPRPVHGQLPPLSPWNTATVETIGGITYFTFGARLPNCHWIETGPVSASSRGFSLQVGESVGDFCLPVLCDNLQTNAIVLGHLPPGDYFFQATYAHFPGVPQPTDPIIYSAMFTVPEAVEPTLRASRAGERVRIDVAARPRG